MAEVKEVKGNNNEIEMPKDYAESILEHAHQVVVGENVKTCRLDIREPQKKIGTKVACDGCGTLFSLVEAKA